MLSQCWKGSCSSSNHLFSPQTSSITRIQHCWSFIIHRSPLVDISQSAVATLQLQYTEFYGHQNGSDDPWKYASFEKREGEEITERQDDLVRLCLSYSFNKWAFCTKSCTLYNLHINKWNIAIKWCLKMLYDRSWTSLVPVWTDTQLHQVLLEMGSQIQERAHH